MKKIELNKNTFWIGKVDDRKVPFHRLILDKGTTYNSYLLMTEKPTIIDTVDIAYGKEYVDNLSKIINPKKIEYVVINHVEPDHAGALPALINKAKNAKIVTTKLASELLKGMFKLKNKEFVIVKNGDTLDIGGKTLKFLETPFLHTEETMITYSIEDKILYSCDIFSTHIANYELFNDLSKKEYIEDFKVYYELIMAPHRPYVRAMLNKIKQLDIDIIAPSHGYILRKNPDKFINMYDEMSKFKSSNIDKKVTIAYSTLSGNTAKIALKLDEGLKKLGIETQIFNLKNAVLSEVIEKIKESDGVLIGSSTKYGDMVGNVEELLKLLKNKGNSNTLAAAFGSYGWSGEAIMHIEEYLKRANFTVVNPNYLIGKTGIETKVFPLRIQFGGNNQLDKIEDAVNIFSELLFV